VEYLKIINEMPDAIAAKDKAPPADYGKCWSDPVYGSCTALPEKTSTSKQGSH
jgi:hypothetical protein